MKGKICPLALHLTGWHPLPSRQVEQNPLQGENNELIMMYKPICSTASVSNTTIKQQNFADVNVVTLSAPAGLKLMEISYFEANPPGLQKTWLTYFLGFVGV